MDVRWSQPGVLVVALVAGACSHRGATLTPPTTGDDFTQYVIGRFGAVPIAACPPSPLHLGATDSVRTEHLFLTLNLPVGFEQGPRRLNVSRVAAAGGVLEGEQWLPGLTIEAVFWNRWTRYEGRPGADVDAPMTLVQLVKRRGYPRFAAAAPWEFAQGKECLLRFAGRTARVFQFELVRRGIRPVWGVEAYWLGRPADGYLGFFGLAPSEAAAAELMAIIAAIDP